MHLSLSQPTSSLILIILQNSSISCSVLCVMIIIVCEGQFLDYLVFSTVEFETGEQPLEDFIEFLPHIRALRKEQSLF